MTDKNFRHDCIRELLQQESISGQAMLVQRLKERYGIDSTQTAVSRDLRRLGVVKKEVKGKLQYELPLSSPTSIILKEGVLGVESNDSMIIIHTFPALADFVGDFIDGLSALPILGCLSGENTVFITPKSGSNIEELKENLCEKLGFIPISGEE